MGVDYLQFRERIGLFYPAALCLKKDRLLTEFDIVSALLIKFYGLKSFPIIIVICFCSREKTCPDWSVNNTDLDIPSYKSPGRLYTHFLSADKCTQPKLNFIFFCMIISILLLISGIESNPGPETPENESFSSISDDSLNFSNLIKNSISFIHLNVQSIVPKLAQISIEYHGYDLMSFTESWLNSSVSDDNITIPSYTSFRNDRVDRIGGGVIVYVKENVNCIQRPDLHVGDLECIWLEIKFKNKSYLYGTFYIPPNSNQQIWDNFYHSIDLAFATNKDLILIGDFNINQNIRNPHDKIRTLLVQYDLHQLIKENTYFTENSSSLLDLIIVSNPSSIISSDVGPPLLDQKRFHLPVIGIINHRKKNISPVKRKVYIYDRGDYESFRQRLSDVNWDSLFVENNVDETSTNITECILNIADKVIPNRIVQIKKTDQPWITKEIKKLIRNKNRIHKKAKRIDSPYYWEKFRKIRNRCNTAVNNAKTDYYKKLSNQIITEKANSQNWYKLIKRLFGNQQKNKTISLLKVNDEIIDDDREMANIFNTFFSEQSNIDDSNVTLPDFEPVNEPVIEHLFFHENEVEDILSILDISKAIGPDSINPRLLKEGCRILKSPLCRLFNMSIELGRFPNGWKLANVTPVFKKESPSNVSNYRPISLISVLGKVMERCVYKHIYNFLSQNNVLTNNQSGFSPGDSAVNQLLYMTNEFGRALDEGKEIRVVFCDISKAFDRVWHRGLIYKLKAIGIKGKLLNWIENYLSERKQRVVINNANSEWREIKAGVPQGSILGPLFFLIFINDIITDIQSNIKLFADDTSLYLIVDDPINTATILNNDLDKIHEWSRKWLVTFNTKKTETMIISRKSNKPRHPDLIMNNSQLLPVDEHKHLGLILSKDGSWHKHIDMVVKKAFSRLNILRKFKFILNRQTLEQLYFTYVRPILEYADVIWDNSTLLLVHKIESVQIEAARIVTGGTKLTSIDSLYKETGWQRLTERREIHRLTYLYKMVNNLTPPYLRNILPNRFQDIHNYSTRNSNALQPPFTRTSLYSNYFLPSSVRSWNKQPAEIQTLSTLPRFKNYFKNKNVKKPIYYYEGSRTGQILHSRLRMNCSNLSSHLFKKHLVQSPNCSCGEIETNEHYLLKCHRYNIYRQRYISNLRFSIRITTNVLLFGSERLSIEQNKEIFKSVQKFIIASNRFPN